MEKTVDTPQWVIDFRRKVWLAEIRELSRERDFFYRLEMEWNKKIQHAEMMATSVDKKS